ncbi:M48 family metallopeptidase [Actinomyces sp. MRS3W]|uniref:M48 family metallopeptidase n=1 Tax=Actinomyces sp. MRS3W TaxID=2800796 RepID=UPI0028FDB75C|nr:M48 family metallopeptidase [Actinomyces sp. MRS3W]MDU0348599.1 M48 family metallopeptidase [Actinomyces sp. MRS3W]
MTASVSESSSAHVPLPVGHERPHILDGATKNGAGGIRRLRHPAELPLLRLCISITVLAYVLWIVFLIWLVIDQEPTGVAATLRNSVTESAGQFLLLLPLLPFVLWFVRAKTYAEMRATAVQMSPTQFPEGYRMVVEAAEHFGMRRVPDAYVVLGNGTINAFATGHGYRRYVAINSDLFEIGGSARDPEALRFVIAHEVGHIAAGHSSFWRQLGTALTSNIPLLGQALSRSQEYTADNHGFDVAPRGASGTMALLTGGKYLGAQVNFHALADRAARETGIWLHIVSWLASHPIITWRAHALRDRSQPGRIVRKPPTSSAWYPPSGLVGSDRSQSWPSPAQMLKHMDALTSRVPEAEEQFGRYPGMHYNVDLDTIRLADPTPVPRAQATAPAVRPEDEPPMGANPETRA